MQRSFGDYDGLSVPVNFRIPFLEPGHSEDDLGFPEAEYHKIEVFGVGKSRIVKEKDLGGHDGGDIALVVSSPIDIVGFDQSGEWISWEIQFCC